MSFICDDAHTVGLCQQGGARRMLKQAKKQSVDDPIDEADEAFSELDVLDDSNSMYMVSPTNISWCCMCTCNSEHVLAAYACICLCIVQDYTGLLSV